MSRGRQTHRGPECPTDAPGSRLGWNCPSAESYPREPCQSLLPLVLIDVDELGVVARVDRVDVAEPEDSADPHDAIVPNKAEGSDVPVVVLVRHELPVVRVEESDLPTFLARRIDPVVVGVLVLHNRNAVNLDRREAEIGRLTRRGVPLVRQRKRPDLRVDLWVGDPELRTNLSLRRLFDGVMDLPQGERRRRARPGGIHIHLLAQPVCVVCVGTVDVPVDVRATEGVVEGENLLGSSPDGLEQGLPQPGGERNRPALGPRRKQIDRTSVVVAELGELDLVHLDRVLVSTPPEAGRVEGVCGRGFKRLVADVELAAFTLYVRFVHEWMSDRPPTTEEGALLIQGRKERVALEDRVLNLRRELRPE